MEIILGLFIFSFLVNAVLFIPFINFLYKISFQRRKQDTLDIFGKLTPIFNKFHQKKAGTPVGGGLLVILSTFLLSLFSLIFLHYFWVPITSSYPLKEELKILFFTFIMFGLLGLFDDIKKMFSLAREHFFGLRFRHKFLLQLVLAGVISNWLYSNLSISLVNFPFFGVLKLGWFYVPFAAFVIVSFANAFNITDGLDGLATGLLFISLVVFWVISSSILDTPLSIFIAVWLGGLVAFLYFNIYPARIMLGDVGSLSFGATLAVIGLILGKAIALVVIGALFVIEVSFSLLQIVSRKFFGKKLFKCAPLHLWLQEKGWEEPKIVMRAWLVGIMLGMFGLWLSLFT